MPGIEELAILFEEGRRLVHEQGGSTEDVDWVELLDGPLPGLVAAGQIEEAKRHLRRGPPGQQWQRESQPGPRGDERRRMLALGLPWRAYCRSHSSCQAGDQINAWWSPRRGMHRP